MLIFDSSHENLNLSTFYRVYTSCLHFQLNYKYEWNRLTETDSKSLWNDIVECIWHKTWTCCWPFFRESDRIFNLMVSLWNDILWIPLLFAINYNPYDIESLSSYLCKKKFYTKKRLLTKGYRKIKSLFCAEQIKSSWYQVGLNECRLGEIWFKQPSCLLNNIIQWNKIRTVAKFNEKCLHGKLNCTIISFVQLSFFSLLFFIDEWFIQTFLSLIGTKWQTKADW